MSSALHIVAAQGIPLAPPLVARLIALLIVEVVLLTLVVLLYVRWVQFKNQPLDEWWDGRKSSGLTPTTLAEIEESEKERLAAEEAAAKQARPAGPGGDVHAI